MSTAHLLALADHLADRLARLDELFAKAAYRGAVGLQPLLQASQAAAVASAEALLAAARSGAVDRLATACEQSAIAVRQLHARLELVPAAHPPTETEWLIADWLGDAAKGPLPPPVLLTLSPQAQASFLPGSSLCSLALPLAERENPLAWTLLANGLGQWLTAVHGVSVGDAEAALQPWLTARLADRLAVRMVGPAYAFALAYAEPERWFEPEGPSLRSRLGWTLADVAAAGFQHPQLADLEALLAAMPGPDTQLPAAFPLAGETLLARLDGLTAVPAMAPQAFATAAAMVTDLRQGLPISARPRMPQTEQAAALDQFKAQSGYRPASAAGLLALLKDQANDAATILNAGWLYRNELRRSWLDELQTVADGAAALRYVRVRGNHLDQLLQKSLETATIHRLLQEARP